MLRILIGTLLLTGCAQAMPANARMVLAPVPDMARPGELGAAIKALRGATGTVTPFPRSGTWEIVWYVAEAAYMDTYQLVFEADGAVLVGSVGEYHRTDGAFSGERFQFEGAVRPEVNVPNVFSYERFDFKAESETHLTGTRSIRVNNRWVALPARATYAKVAPATDPPAGR